MEKKLNTKAIKTVIEAVGGDVKIVAATKTVPAEVINLLPHYGITVAGENRVQEFLSKYDSVQNIEWHFIGRLQTNKVKYIVDKVSMIQSLDRKQLADEIEKQCGKIDKKMDVLIEVNSGEETKGGIAAAELVGLADYVTKCPHLNLLGLMCIPKIDAKKEDYLKMHALFDLLKKHYNGIKYLSMGMSADYQIAIECGANIIRPGSVLFGERLAE